MQSVNIHLVSDFTCDTLLNISGIIATQFPNVKINRFFWPFVRYVDQVDEIFDSLDKNPGLILFSILQDDIEEKIEDFVSRRSDCKIIPVVDFIISETSSFVGQEVKKITRRSNNSYEYIKRMEAMNFTINHDDGRMAEDCSSADIILIGVSRTSKSPTSIYLSNRGYKVANIPFVSANLMPKALRNPENRNKIIALSIDMARLLWLRESRMDVDGVNSKDSNYASEEIVRDELLRFRRYCAELQCRIIDVTTKSIEEVAAHILKIMQ